MSVKRFDRINEEVKKQLSDIIREMKDPRVCEMTSVVMVSVTNDYSVAKVRISVYDKDDKVRADTVDALNHAAGFMAHELGQRMDIRHLPKLMFSLDNSIEYSVHISDVLSKLNITPETDENGGNDENGGGTDDD